MTTDKCPKCGDERSAWRKMRAEIVRIQAQIADTNGWAEQEVGA